MSPPRPVPLFDASQGQGSWNERMAPGECAVHYSSFAASAPAPFCTVCSDLDTAEAYARTQVAATPTLRCTIYDHNGLIGPPLREIRGAAYKGDSELTPRFRRWAGGFLFCGGTLLILFDWTADFRLSWPAMIGTRMFIPGLVLLVMEAVLVLHARLERRRPIRVGTP